MTVSIITPFTSNAVMDALEKNKTSEMVQNLQILANIY